MSVVILFYMIVYLISALIFVFIVRKITKLGIIRWLAVAFVIFLPTWDVVLGYLVYYPACAFIPKIAIYETAETEGIYYEGINDCYMLLDSEGKNMTDEELTVVGDISDPLSNNFQYAEAKVTQKYNGITREMINIIPVIYKCISVPKHKDSPAFFRTSCTITAAPQSKYMVKVRTIKLGILEINFKKIINRSSGKLMAEYNRVNRWNYAGLWFIPFFEWLDWRWWSKSEGSAHCPLPDDRYFYFEYEVLKPVK